ncbi:MAG: hypothetical protein ACFFCM_04760 [Promethearchaeota archaeon]
MIGKTQIGKIEKKSLGSIKKRKIIEIPLLFQINLPYIRKEILEEYSKKLTSYHTILKKWIQDYQSNIGKIDKIFLQALTEANINQIQELDYIENEQNFYYLLIKDLIGGGAKLQITEDTELVNESLAWLSQIQNYDALDIDFQLFLETIKDRDISITRKIEETLNENETAILLIGSEHSFSFSDEIEHIKFRPPIIEDIIKLLKNST